MAPFQQHNQTRDQGRHDGDADDIEERVKDGELESIIVRRNADGSADPVDRLGQDGDEGDGDNACRHVEDEVGEGEALAGDVCAHGAEQSRHGSADIGSDGDCQAVLVGDLAGGERRDAQDQRRVARLHHHCRDDADGGIDQKAGKTRHGELRQVDRILKGLEACLHVMDAQEQEADPGQDIAQSLQRLAALKHHDDAEHDHRHGVGRDIDLQADAGDQPGAGRGADVGFRR